MKVALIPPASLVEYSARRPMQMLIPQGIGGMKFDSFYRSFGRDERSWLMMDNGMFEQPPLEPDRLIKIAEMFNVQEIVVPDVWDNLTQTRMLIRRFFKLWNREHRAYHPCFQVVIHGTTRVENAHNFVRSVADEHPEVTTFAISRSFSRRLNDAYARVKLAQWIDKKYKSAYDVHFLGFEDDHHEELAPAAQFVRSIDTAAPFIAAYRRAYLQDGTRCSRPENYFETEAWAYPIGLIVANIRYLDKLASGR